MRKAGIERQTKETGISVELNLDGSGVYEVVVDTPFFKHLLELFAKNAVVDLQVKASGDLQHHLVEDTAICIGKALLEALGEKKGIARYGFFILPMDESCALTAIDLSGRSSLVFKAEFAAESVEGFSTGLAKEFLQAFCREAGCALYVQLLSGENEHHKMEAIFKCLGRALREAIKIDKRINGEIPSTKGKL